MTFPTKIIAWACVCAAMGPIIGPGPLGAAQPAAAEAPLDTADLEQLAARLDAADYYTRESTSRRLRALVKDPRQGVEVATKLAKYAIDHDLSLEAQQRLDDILGQVSLAEITVSDTLTAEQAAELVGNLGDDRYAVRENATRRLKWLLRNSENVVPLMLAARKRLADQALSESARSAINEQYENIRQAWLLAEPGKCVLPAVDRQQMVDWVKLVSLPTENEAVFARQRAAMRELEDLLVREEYREQVTRQVREQLEQADNPAGQARLRELVDLSLPAMVAEIWGLRTSGVGVFMIGPYDPFDVNLVTTQYLHVGVPQMPEGAPRPTHFDYCDDERAHCVSGNTLAPGDYPVGVAFPHPTLRPSFFYLVNLPTPRDRLLYDLQSERSEALRLRTISERTCAAYLKQQRPLTDEEVPLLVVLDQSVVGNFAGEYFAKVDDKPLNGLGNQLMVGQTTRHGALCYALAINGNRAAAPGLIKAIADKRILPPDEKSFYDLANIALLAIAQRDPWERSDDWLLEQLGSSAKLMNNVDPAPELAATAAAILGERYGRTPQALGLIQVEDHLFPQVGLTPFRFESDEQRKTAHEWFRARRHELARAQTR